MLHDQIQDIVLLTSRYTQGFFTLYRNLFDRLASDECAITSHSPDDYPSLGYSSWSWDGSATGGKAGGEVNTKEGARYFYNFWLGFATAKEFAWAEQWNVNEAPDRQIRRHMERDNKKARETARKEYNDTVRVRVYTFRAIVRANELTSSTISNW